jgi:hypothetical protein
MNYQMRNDSTYLLLHKLWIAAEIRNFSKHIFCIQYTLNATNYSVILWWGNDGKKQ